MKRERKRTTQTRVTEELQRMEEGDKEIVLNTGEGESTDR